MTILAIDFNTRSRYVQGYDLPNCDSPTTPKSNKRRKVEKNLWQKKFKSNPLSQFVPQSNQPALSNSFYSKAPKRTSEYCCVI